MEIEIYMGNDLKKFAGKIDDKEFDFTVEEFVNLMGAFQQAVAKAQGIELDDEDLITAKKAMEM